MVAPMKSMGALAAILAAFWVINSGYFKPLLLGFGVLSIAIVVALMARMKSRDGEYFPLIMPAWRLPLYLLWLLGQIVAANIDVARRVWRGKSSISPTVFTVKATQATDVGQVLYANSITMTPGTVTLAVNEGLLEVHALSAEAAEDLRRGEMDRRIAALEAG
jgi:multicomponent Na+:H+ antiporter subunit E